MMGVWIAWLVIGLGISGGDLRTGVPQTLHYSGFLMNAQDSTALSDTLEITFSLWNTQTGGTCLWTETHPQVVVDRGYFHVLLGSLRPLPDSLFQEPALYLELQVGDEPLTPRTPLASVAYALHSLRADTAAFTPLDTLTLDARYLNQTRAETLQVTLQDPGAALAVDAQASLGSAIQGLAAQVQNTGTGGAMAGQFVVEAGGGTAYGVYAQAQAQGTSMAYGVLGRALNLSNGTAYGGYFYALPYGTGPRYGVYGFAVAPSGAAEPSVGVRGYARNNGAGQAIGGWFESYLSGTGQHYGLLVRSAGTMDTTWGLHTRAWNNGTWPAIAGAFQILPYGTGPKVGLWTLVRQAASTGADTAVGVRAEVSNPSDGPALGGIFLARDSSDDQVLGLWSRAEGAGARSTGLQAEAYSANARAVGLVARAESAGDTAQGLQATASNENGYACAGAFRVQNAYRSVGVAVGVQVPTNSPGAKALQASLTGEGALPSDQEYTVGEFRGQITGTSANTLVGVKAYAEAGGPDVYALGVDARAVPLDDNAGSIGGRFDGETGVVAWGTYTGLLIHSGWPNAQTTSPALYLTSYNQGPLAQFYWDISRGGQRYSVLQFEFEPYGEAFARTGWSTWRKTRDGTYEALTAPLAQRQELIARGTARLQKGRAIVQFPAWFSEEVSERDDITVTVTPVGGWSALYLTRVGPRGFEVASAQGDPEITFHWMAIGVRKGYTRPHQAPDPKSPPHPEVRRVLEALNRLRGEP